MKNMIILFNLWLIIIIVRFSNKLYNIKFVTNLMQYVSVCFDNKIWQGFKLYVVGFKCLINDYIKMYVFTILFMLN